MQPQSASTTFIRHLLPFRFNVLGLCFFISVVLIASLQCLSAWNYAGDQVDESELVHYAVGFLGGDLDPYWYGYGYVGMLILGAVYFVMGSLYVLAGSANNFLEVASFLYDTDAFMIAGRLVFALIGATTVMLYVEIGKIFKISPMLLLAYVVISFSSVDGLRYANYIRCDQLVGLMCPLLLLVLLQQRTFKREMFLLPILLAVAFNCKMSALALLGIFPIRILQSVGSYRQKAVRLLVVLGVFVAAMVITNPFNDVFSTVLSLIQNMIVESRVSVSKVGHLGFIPTSQAILTVLLQTIGPPLLWSLILLPLLLWRYGWQGAWLVIVLVFLVAPYYLTSEICEYWFIPVFPLVRFLSILLLSTVFDLIPRKKRACRMLGVICMASLVLVVGWRGVFYRYPQFARQTLTEQSNARTARNWLLGELKKGRIVYLDKYWNHVMPKLYGHDIRQARLISRAFIYERDKNKFLEEAFHLFMTKRYLPQFSAPPVVYQAVAYAPADFTEERERRSGAYFVVSPSVADRYRRGDFAHLSDAKRREAEFLRSYYEMEMRGEPLKRFTAGRGAPLYVYELK